MARNSYGMKKYEAADASRKRANGRAKVYGKKFEASAPSLGKVALTIAGGAGAGFINSERRSGRLSFCDRSRHACSRRQ